MAAIEIRDAIHTRITLSSREREVLDHPSVQRLRHIRQLGFVSLVYPSATHDRFSHSLGTLHVAGRLADQILFDESSSALARILAPKEKRYLREILRLAGLLHDIGHAPFSHSAELVMPPVSSLAFPQGWLLHPTEQRPATHEDYSALLIDGMAQGPDAVLTKDEAAIIASLVHHKKIKIPGAWGKMFSKKINAPSLHAIARSLISSNIDADRMDYLLRDAHFTGVPYGHFDLDWLVSNLGVITHKNEYLLAIGESSIQALEHYLFARSHMYSQVYMHKTAKCFEYYFQQTLKEKEIPYTIPAQYQAYAALRDSTLTEHLFAAAEHDARSWSGRLMRREPSKRICRITGDHAAAQKLFASLRRELTPKGIYPFLCASHKSFLEIPAARHASPASKQGSFLFGLAAVPLVVTRKHLGITSAASLANHSQLLAQYHRDIMIDDIYILPEDYASRHTFIYAVMKKHHVLAPLEILLEEK